MPKSTRITEKVKPPAGCAPASAGALPAVSLPCLYSNNVIDGTPTDGQEKLETVLGVCNLLSPYHKRQAHTLFANVHRLVTKVAPTVGHVGFLTITTPDNLTDNAELRKRFRSFLTNFLTPHPDFGEWVNTKEVQKRGAWHLHLVIVLSQDIRDGVDFEQIAEGNYSSASPYLRRLWKELREALPLYGFGRSELLPVKAGPDAIARYVGKYISKHIGSRTEENKGVRLVSYSQGWTRNSCRFAWNTKNASEWRRKLALFAERHGCQEFYQLSAKLGQGWAYRYAQDIFDIDQVLVEEKYNASQEGRTIERRKYQDETIARSRAKKAKREFRMMKECVNHSRLSLALDAKRKFVKATIALPEWLKALRPCSDTDDHSPPGMPSVENGFLVIRSGDRAGEILF